MIEQKKSKPTIYIWIIIVLVVLNLSTIGSFLYHRYRYKMNHTRSEHFHKRRPPMFLKDDYKKNMKNFPKHLKLKQEYRDSANEISRKMDEKRLQILDELSKENPDTTLLNRMAAEFGNMHKDLKLLTIEFYLNIKAISTKEEQEELYHYFHYLLKMDERKSRHKKND